MQWARILAYITGTVDQKLLLRNDCAGFSGTGAFRPPADSCQTAAR